MTLLDKIIDGTSSDTASGLLRSMLVLSTRLGANELTSWVKAELNGYEVGSELPTYRGPFPVPVKATLSGPFGSGGTNTLTPHGIPEGYENLFRVEFRDPLATIESLAASNKDLGSPWDPTVVAMYNDWADQGKVAHIEMMGVYSAYRVITPGLVAGVLDAVRTKALELALELQSQFPSAGEKGGPTVADPAVSSVVTTVTNNIYGPVGNLAQGHDIHQRAKLKVGDLGATITEASEILPPDSLKAFAALLAEDVDEHSRRGKLTKFVESVREGGIAVVVGVAADVAANRLLSLASQFLGWT